MDIRKSLPLIKNRVREDFKFSSNCYQIRFLHLESISRVVPNIE
jgi:hypothetical protein